GSVQLRTSATRTGTRRRRALHARRAISLTSRWHATAAAEPVRLIVLTQVVDADHPALAQTVDILDALARRCDEVVVLCDHVGRNELPANVRIRTFGAATRAGRGAAFERVLAEETLFRRGRRPDGVLVHMIPTFL